MYMPKYNINSVYTCVCFCVHNVFFLIVFIEKKTDHNIFATHNFYKYMYSMLFIANNLFCTCSNIIVYMYMDFYIN